MIETMFPEIAAGSFIDTRTKMNPQALPYQILYPLRKGGQAQVYLARIHQKTQYEHLVAMAKKRTLTPRQIIEEGLCVLKLGLPDRTSQDQLRDERIYLMQFSQSVPQHPHILKIFSVASDSTSSRYEGKRGVGYLMQHPNTYESFAPSGLMYLVLEYMQGGSLSELLRDNQQPLSENTTILIARQVADALVYLHNSMSLVHQDISSSNILLRIPYKKSSFFGGRWLPDCVVADFATAENPTLSEHRDAFGKHIYQPPERRKTPLAKLSFSLDIYSLGILMYEMLVGYNIFHEYATHIDQPFKPLHAYAPKTSPALQRIINAALEPNPDNRPSAVEILHLLQQL